MEQKRGWGSRDNDIHKTELSHPQYEPWKVNLLNFDGILFIFGYSPSGDRHWSD